MSRRFFLIPISISFFFLHCAREVMIDIPEAETRSVVICHFSHGEPFRVNISISQPIYDNEDPQVPENVDVKIAKEGVFLDKLFQATDDFGNTYWESRDLAETDRSYSINVRVNDLPLVTAESAIPVFAPIHPVQIDPSRVTQTPLSDGRRLMTIPIVLRIKDLPPEKRYFAFYFKHDIVTDDGTTFEGLPTNYSADGRTLSLLHDLSEPAVLINEKFWSDGRDSLALNAVIPYNPANSEKPGRLYIEWRTLSEQFYQYHLSIDRQGNNLPLSDPDAVYNNIDGGYGNFSGYSVEVQVLDIPF